MAGAFMEERLEVMTGGEVGGVFARFVDTMLGSVLDRLRLPSGPPGGEMEVVIE